MAGTFSRTFMHMCTGTGAVHRRFDADAMTRIRNAIIAAELGHAGEIRFAVEGALHSTPLFKGQSARERAIEVFSQLRVWDTEHSNGVLIYLLLADRNVEIVADRGVHAKVNSQDWEKICRAMEVDFKQANFKDGVVKGIQAIAQHLVEHFPAQDKNQNELPDKPLML